MWFETTRFVYFVKLKHASRTFSNLRLQRTAFHSKNGSKECSQSAPRVRKPPPKCLRELQGDVLRGHTHLQSSLGASPIRHSGQSVINTNKIEDSRDTLGSPWASPAPSSPTLPNYVYYYILHLFPFQFTFFYLRFSYVYRHAAPGVGGTPTLGGLGRGWGGGGPRALGSPALERKLSPRPPKALHGSLSIRRRAQTVTRTFITDLPSMTKTETYINMVQGIRVKKHFLTAMIPPRLNF